MTKQSSEFALKRVDVIKNISTPQEKMIDAMKEVQQSYMDVYDNTAGLAIRTIGVELFEEEKITETEKVQFTGRIKRTANKYIGLMVEPLQTIWTYSQQGEVENAQEVTTWLEPRHDEYFPKIQDPKLLLEVTRKSLDTEISEDEGARAHWDSNYRNLELRRLRTIVELASTKLDAVKK